MANYGAVENVIEWLRGEHRATLSLSDPETIKAVIDMASKDDAVEIVDRGKHTLCATMPLEYVTLKKPRKRKDEQTTNGKSEDHPSGHKAEAKAPRGKGGVLRKRRIPHSS